VALTGFMAAGKSTVGRVLATILGWQFLDLDCAIESGAGRTIREIFATEGEPRFRELESDALRSMLNRIARPAILALGGGTFTQAGNADLLRRHEVKVVFLELPVEELLRRAQSAAERDAETLRPLAADAEAFRALYERRLPIYRETDLTVHTAGKPAELVAQEIVAALRLAATNDGHR
jgi:shikimate kinase